MEYEHEEGRPSSQEKSSMSITKLIYFLEHLDSPPHRWRRYAKVLPSIMHEGNAIVYLSRMIAIFTYL